MKTIILNAVGDFILHAKGQTTADPFEFVYEKIKACDILIGNNETTLTDNSYPFLQKSVLLRSPRTTSVYLLQAGFDVLHLANNHIFDFGVSGALETINELDRYNIAHIGIGITKKNARKPIIIRRNGLKIGFIGIGNCSESIEEQNQKVYVNTLNSATLFSDIKCLRNQVDIVILSAHWDYECIDLPSPQIQNFARKLIDAGVNLILGHHPHIPHGIERYKDGLIVYSLGNFQFKCTLRPELDYSFIFTIELSQNGIGNYAITPLVIQTDSRPKPANKKESEAILRFIDKGSRPLAGGITPEIFENAACIPFFKDNLAAWAARIEKYGEEHWNQCMKWLGQPDVSHRLWVLAQKRKWTIKTLMRSLELIENP